MRIRTRLPGWRGGLRARLVIAFILVTLAAIASAATAGYISARNSLLAADQDRAIRDLRQRVTALAPELQYPPDQETLNAFAAQLPGNATVTYRDLQSTTESAHVTINPELRDAVRDHTRVQVQYVSTPTGPELVIGMPVTIWQPGDASQPSGLEVYSGHDLAPTYQQVQVQSRTAWLVGAVAVPFAILVGLLSSNGVLRPVRDLRHATRRLSAGDLTARLRVRGTDELADLAHTFNETADELERTIAELQRLEEDARRFVADVSHELRTPLSAMLAVTDVLEADVPRMPDDAARSAGLLVRETRRLTRLVEDLMEVSRFDAGTASLILEEVDVGEAIRATLVARNWDDTVDLDLPRDVRAQVDRRRLDVIIANLVGNALRHGRPPVTVVLHADRDWIEVVVNDHGDGIPDDALPHVFDRFFKADTARGRSESSGLGLAIAQQNARIHGGDIEVGNVPGGGARFVVRLRRNADQNLNEVQHDPDDQ
ncbi:ATP-binding protein [Rhodococcus sp. BE178]|uniref:ATP-binding protein n=1 Tax=Rhodococcus sp. BE178 TaxID=2817737 RepID=UPI003D25A0F3